MQDSNVLIQLYKAHFTEAQRWRNRRKAPEKRKRRIFPPSVYYKTPIQFTSTLRLENKEKKNVEGRLRLKRGCSNVLFLRGRVTARVAAGAEIWCGQVHVLRQQPRRSRQLRQGSQTLLRSCRPEPPPIRRRRRFPAPCAAVYATARWRLTSDSAPSAAPNCEEKCVERFWESLKSEKMKVRVR